MNLLSSVFLFCVFGSYVKESSQSSVTCLDVHQRLNSSLFLSHPRDAEDAGMCSSSKTCCTKGAEAKFREGAKKDAQVLLQNVTSSLTLLLTNNLNNFQDKFRGMILSSHNATMSMLNKNYTKLGSSSVNPVASLFTSLLSYMAGKEIDLHLSVNKFFDDLFPEIYHKMIKARHRDVSPNFVDCLKGAQQDINPFGTIPHQIAIQLDKSFDAAKTILKSMRLAIEIVNQTANYNISPSCSRSLVKLRYCAQCQGYIYAKACPGLCSNVARGCFAHLTELDKPWIDFVYAFERLSTGIIGYYNIENVLEKLSSKIAEAIKYTVDNSQDWGKRVKIACGHPKRYSRQVHGTISAPEASQFIGGELRQAYLHSSQQPTASSSLYIRLQTFVYQLIESKGFFTKIADEVCLLDSMSSSSESCWNGESLGRYRKAIAGDGVQAQKFNPELSVMEVRHAEVNLLVDKLRQMKEILKMKIRTIPESDSYVMQSSEDGSGSGQHGKNDVYYKYNDDEDYGDFSGSGDGDDPKPSTDNNFIFEDKASTGHSGKGSGSSSHTLGDTGFASLVSIILARAILI